MKIGILPLARPTFDVPFAEEMLARMLGRLDAAGHQTVGERRLLLDQDASDAAMDALAAEKPDVLLVLQVTFTDASTVVAAADRFSAPLAIWAVPEPRLGGRLRLNAFCGLNLASHALGRNGHRFSWAYASPDDLDPAQVNALLAGSDGAPMPPLKAAKATPEGREIAASLRGKKIARIGEHPAGFDTCAYDKVAIRELTGVGVAELSLDHLFETARHFPNDIAAPIRAATARQITGLDQVDQPQLDRSLRLKAGLDAIRADGGFDAFAIRCWPETFTEYGGAVCGPVAMMGEARVPCACEADVYGALTQLILQAVSGQPVFLTDLVDIDTSDDTGVVWHCGQAPYSMRDRDAEATATIHTNRKQPLLYQFPLKPGTVTFVRISQAFNEPKMVLGAGEMLKRPLAFTGTSGVVRFASGAEDALKNIIASGLEHHVAIAYGDHRDRLRGVAGALGLPVQEI